jgi:minor capsid protein
VKLTLLEEFAQLLDDLDLGTYHADGTAGGIVFLAVLPEAPDRCIAVARYGGAESDSANPWDEPRIQLRFRGPAVDARVAEQDAQAAYDALHGLGNRELPGGTWLQLAVGINGGPVYIGRDTNDRHEYTVNLRCDVQRSTANRGE